MKKILVILLCFIYTGFVQAENNTTGNVFFIRLNIDDNTIGLGTFNTLLQKEETAVITAEEPETIAAAKMQIYLKDKMPSEQSASALFFIHAMWGSNNWFVKTQVADFSATYTRDTTKNIDAVFYILWDTKAVTYSANRGNALRSSELLHRLFSILSTVNTDTLWHYDLMCHSMGNKIFFNLMETAEYNKRLFDHIILAAADVDEHSLHNEKVIRNLTAIAGDCHILFNKYDGLLVLSSLMNAYEPLGLNPDVSINETYPNIQFINCSFLTDNNKFPSSATGHLYYSTSITTKRKIRSIISS